MIRRATSLLVVSLLALTFSSCDTALNQSNPNELTTENFFQNGEQLSTAVTGVYANFHVTGQYKRRKFFIYDALSGVIAPTASAESWIPALFNWSVNAGNSGLDLHWKTLYQGIQRANRVIEQAPQVERGISEQRRQRFIGEVRFLRAIYYHKLVTLWGDVPLIDEVVDSPEGEPRAPTEEVYSLIQEDLQFAMDNLPESYDGANVGRATSMAAQALMGRVQLDLGNFSEAQSTFQSLIDNGVAPGGGQLQLVDAYFDNFKEETENNTESIFEIQFSESSGGNAWFEQGGNGSNRTFRAQEYGFRQWRNVVASEAVLNEMNAAKTDQVSDIEDPRASNTFYFACDTFNNGQNLYTTQSHDCGTGLPVADRSTSDDDPSWKKYQTYYKDDRSGFVANSGINFREIRLPEVLLGLAEAQIQQGSIAEAVSLMNQIRSRVGLDGYNDGAGTVTTDQEAMDALSHEFVMEFTGEAALYHFLRRNPTFLEELNPNAFDPYLMPIPREEIDNNPAIGPGDQNPGF